MKNREYIAKLFDSIMAVLQTLILSLIPIFIKNNPVQKTVSYIIVTIVIIVYITVFRNKLIKMIILQQGIDTDYIKNKTLIPLFNGDLLPKVRSIANLDKTSDKFELSYRFLIWNEAATFIINYFWDSGKLINVVTKKTTSFSKNKIYKQEIDAIIEKLLEIEKENDFSCIIEDFNCSTLQKEIETKKSIMTKILHSKS